MRPLKKYWHLILIGLTLILLRIWEGFSDSISWDVFGYYLYLPSQIIYSDLFLADHSWLDQLMLQYEPSSTFYQLVDIGNGNRITKYTMGLAILYAPWFFLAHIIALVTSYPTDGLSLPYQVIVTMGGLFYCFLGFIILNKILKKFFSPTVATTTVLVLFFGTNIMHLAGFGSLLSHGILFSLYTLLIWFTIKWNQKHDFKSSIWIGLTAGIITLIRPTEIICLLIPLLWVNQTASILARTHELLLHWKQLLVAGICFTLPILPQLIYWKSGTGSWLFYSYTNPGEGLDLLSPHTIDFLFSFRKGWFVYTPLVLITLYGLFKTFKRAPWIASLTITYLVIAVYLASSWTTWWYAGGSFSSRSMVSSYALLTIPLGFVIQDFRSKNIASKIALGFITLFVGLNIFQTIQWKIGVIDRERMTFEYYVASFGKIKVTEKERELLLVNRPTTTQEFFEDKHRYQSQEVFYSDEEVELSQNNPFFNGLDANFNSLSKSDHLWFTSEVQVFVDSNYRHDELLIVNTVEHRGGSYKYRTTETYPQQLIPGKWNSLILEFLTPEFRLNSDPVKIYLWYRGSGTVTIKDFTINSFERVK